MSKIGQHIVHRLDKMPAEEILRRSNLRAAMQCGKVKKESKDENKRNY